MDSDKYANDFLRWINDPSYYVAGSALSAYLENENNLNREEVASRFGDEENIRILVALAGYFLSAEVGDKAGWFNHKLDSLTGEDLYYFIGYYSEYFASVASAESGQAIETLSKIAKSNPANYVRIAAFMGLFGFIDQPGVLDLAKDIYSQENDPLAKRYQEMFLSQYVDDK
jgi:aminopeptidase N